MGERFGMRRGTRAGQVAIAMAAVFVAGVTGCAGSGAPGPTVPEVTYAGRADEGDPTPTVPTFSTGPGASTAAPDDPDPASPAPNPAIDDVVQYAAIGGSEITGDWHGGCRTNPSVGVAGMTWYGDDLQVANGAVLTELRLDVSISGAAGDGRPNVESWNVQGSFDDGRGFDSWWSPTSRGSLLDVSAEDGVLVFAYEADAPVGTFDLRVYCD